MGYDVNATFNNISAISWQSVLLVEETTNLLQITDKIDHIMLYTSPWAGLELTTSVVIGIGKSNYHTIMATTASQWIQSWIIYIVYLMRVLYTRYNVVQVVFLPIYCEYIKIRGCPFIFYSIPQTRQQMHFGMQPTDTECIHVDP